MWCRKGSLVHERGKTELLEKRCSRNGEMHLVWDDKNFAQVRYLYNCMAQAGHLANPPVQVILAYLEWGKGLRLPWFECAVYKWVIRASELSRSVLDSLGSLRFSSQEAFPAWLPSCSFFLWGWGAKTSHYYGLLLSTAAFYFAFIWFLTSVLLFCCYPVQPESPLYFSGNRCLYLLHCVWG